MPELRQDSWRESDDLVLANTILEHIRNGSTQLAAFEEVGEKIERTAAACGFRWNSAVRKRYEKEILQAKEERRQRKPSGKAKVASYHLVPDVAIQSDSLEAIDTALDIINNMKITLETMSKQIMNLISENESLKKKIAELDVHKAPEITLSEDYHAFLDILSRARQLGLDKIS